jgi:hypothetical protein
MLPLVLPQAARPERRRIASQAFFATVVNKPVIASAALRLPLEICVDDKTQPFLGAENFKVLESASGDFCWL